MGAAYNPPDSLEETYVPEPQHGCVAKLEYEIEEWSAFWMKLEGADLSPYRRMTFDVKADPSGQLPERVRVELKRACTEEGCREVSIIYVVGISERWQEKKVNREDFGPTGYTDPLSSFEDMGELIFVFEADFAGPGGIVYLDNIAFKH